jgi:hypothetical protein
VTRDRAERAGGPRRLVVGGVLADPVLAGIHQRRDLGDVGAAGGVGEGGDLRGPWPGVQRDERAGPVPDAGVDDGGDVAGSGQVPFGDRVSQDTGGVQAGQLGGSQGPPQPAGLVAGFPAVARRQGGHEQVVVALIPGRSSFGRPDRVQQRQMGRIGQGLVAGLGGREQLAVAVQHPGQHGQRILRRGTGSGRAAGSAGTAVVAGELGSRARARGRVGSLGRGGEHVGGVDVGAAGQRDVGMLPVLGPGDHGQAGVHGAALSRVIGDRVAQLGIFVIGEQEVPVGPAALPGDRVGVEGPADEKTAPGDRLDAQEIAVGERPAGLTRFGHVVVTGTDDQITGAGPGAVGDGHREAAGDDAQGDEVLADAAVQLAAQRMVSCHQQRAGTVSG